MTKNVQIDGSKISDWDSFHSHFSEAFGFPQFYGRNMNAWIDCMTYLDEPGAGMTSVHVAQGDVVVLCVGGVEGLKQNCPDIYEALLECSAFVNFRRIEREEQAILALAFYA